MVALVAFALFICIGPGTRSQETMRAPNDLALLVLVGWQLGYGLWSRTTLRSAFGGLAALILIGRQFDTPWMFADHACWFVQVAILWLAVLPLFCRDKIAEELRVAVPSVIANVAFWNVVVGPLAWRQTGGWTFAVTTTLLTLVSLMYWWRYGWRWHVLAAGWTGALAVVVWTASAAWVAARCAAQARTGLVRGRLPDPCGRSIGEPVESGRDASSVELVFARRASTPRQRGERPIAPVKIETARYFPDDSLGVSLDIALSGSTTSAPALCSALIWSAVSGES